MSLDETLQGFELEEVPENVYEADKFRPRFRPGQKVRFLFKFENEGKKSAIAVANNILRLNFQAEALFTFGEGGVEVAVPLTSSGNPPTLRFQQVDSRVGKKSDGTMIPPSLHMLFRALVGKEQAKLTGTDPRLIIAKMRELDGRETFDGTIGWKLYDADTQTEYSTKNTKSSTSEKRDGTTAHYEPWPVLDGQPAETVGGEYPRDFIRGFIEKKIAPVAETVQGD